MTLPFWKALFALNCNQKFTFFSGIVLGPHFSHLFKIVCQKGWFRTPFRASWAQKGTPNRPSGAKRLTKSIRGAHFLRVRHQLARPNGSRGAQRSFSMDFAWVLHPFVHDFKALQIICHDFAKLSTSIFCIVFTRRQKPPRTSKEPGTQRTPQNMILQIAIRLMPSTANKRFSQTALAQNGGRRCHAAWRIQ